MALGFFTVGGKVTAAGLNALVNVANAVGSTMVVPTGTAAGSGTTPAISTLGSVSFTAVGTSLSVNGCFSGLYDNYEIDLDISATTVSQVLVLQLNAAGTPSIVNYVSELIQPGPATAAISSTTGVTTGLQVFRADTTNGSGGTFKLLSPFLAEKTKLTVASADASFLNLGGGSHTLTNSYNGFTLLIGSGTITGTIRVRGMNKG